MFGRRPDATLVTGLPAIRRFMPFVSPRRNESLVLYEQDVAVEATLRALEAIPGEERPTLFHALLHAIAHACHERTRINRFVAGGRLWQRDGVWLTFSAKQAFETRAPVIKVKRRFDVGESLEAVAADVRARLGRGRSGEKGQSDTEMELLLKLPGFVVRLAMWLASRLDGWGLLPRAMIEPDPLFCSVFVANLGSVGLDAGYHHLWEWGTCPIFCVMGRVRETPEGRRVTLKWSFDERIADGFYAARALELVRERLEAPEPD